MVELILAIPFLGLLILIAENSQGWFQVPILFSSIVILSMSYLVLLLMILQSRSSEK
jgi:hypothetical protein